MASPTQQTWVWVNSGRWWRETWHAKGSRVRDDWATEQQKFFKFIYSVKFILNLAWPYTKLFSGFLFHKPSITFCIHISLSSVFIYLLQFLAVLSPHCYAQTFPSCRGQKPSGVQMSHCRWGAQLWGAAASLVAAGRPSCYSSRALEHWLRRCGMQAQMFRSMWDLPRPGTRLKSLALQGRFLTTQPPGKTCPLFFSLSRNKQLQDKN